MIRYLLPGLLLLIGCATYMAQPLDPDEILEQVKEVTLATNTL